MSGTDSTNTRFVVASADGQRVFATYTLPFFTREAELEQLRPFTDYAPLPPHLAHPENDPDPSWVAPTWLVDLAVRPPDDPELRALWEAVEPGRGG